MIRKLSEAFERLKLRVTGRLVKSAGAKVAQPPPKRQKRAKRHR